MNKRINSTLLVFVLGVALSGLLYAQCTKSESQNCHGSNMWGTDLTCSGTVGGFVVEETFTDIESDSDGNQNLACVDANEGGDSCSTGSGATCSWTEIRMVCDPAFGPPDYSLVTTTITQFPINYYYANGTDCYGGD